MSGAGSKPDDAPSPGRSRPAGNAGRAGKRRQSVLRKAAAGSEHPWRQAHSGIIEQAAVDLRGRCEATFREYIRDPKAKVPGTKMIYGGLKDEQKANDLVAFLKQFDADGKKK
jgi:cytochrome c2